MPKDPSKTEKPTKKRIDKARNEDGNVLMSMDIISLGTIAAGLLALIHTSQALTAKFKIIFATISGTENRVDWTTQEILLGFKNALFIITAIMTPLIIAVIIAGIFTVRAQTGNYFSTGPLKWKFDLKFKQGFMSMMPNKQNMINLTLTIGKIILIGFIIYLSVKGNINEILLLAIKPVQLSINWIMTKSFFMTVKILTVFSVIAAIDYGFKRKKYYEDLMMTKQEVKDEHRNSEGDPIVKSRIRAKMRELLRSRMMQELPNADIIITNPTHVAVALQYKKNTPAPRVVAKGLRKRAEAIKKIARENKIPIVEAPPLARSLYRNTNIFEFIDEKFFSAVATILAKLHREGIRKFY